VGFEVKAVFQATQEGKLELFWVMQRPIQIIDGSNGWTYPTVS
jgi:hypothetical protein